MATYTASQLQKLKDAYSRGVLEVREGDSWIKFQSLSDIRQAIKDIEQELDGSNAAPKGPRLVSIKQGYR